MTNATFWDKTAPKYAAKKIANPAAYEATLSETRNWLTSTDHILELGCGTGGTAITLASSVERVTATDISGKMIELAKQKLATTSCQNVTFIKAGAGSVVLGEDFDAIVAFSLLHLIDDLQDKLEAIHGQLKPGGVFISKTPCLGDRSALLKPMVKALSKLGLAPSVQFLERDNLTHALQRAGFRIERDMTFDTAWANPFIVARKN